VEGGECERGESLQLLVATVLGEGVWSYTYTPGYGSSGVGDGRIGSVVAVYPITWEWEFEGFFMIPRGFRIYMEKGGGGK